MILLAILGAVNNNAAQIVSAVLLFVFLTFFGIGWLGMSWLYSAEIVGLRVRAQANAVRVFASFKSPVIDVTCFSCRRPATGHSISWSS